MLYSITIAPMSVNKCWQGRRFKTPEYKAWRTQFAYTINGVQKIEGFVEVWLTFYIQNFALSDTGNMEKATMDALVEAGCMDDDRFVVVEHLKKVKVSTEAEERIEVRIEPYDEFTCSF